MTLDEWYAQNQGKSLLVPGQPEALRGQCFMAFDFVLHDVYGLPYFYASGAIDIWETPGSLTNSFDLIPYNPSLTIKKGDFVIYGAGVGSPYGHVSVAAQDGVGNNYIGYDSNWGHNLTLHLQPHNDQYNQYILGVLRFKGNEEPMITAADVTFLFRVALGLEATQEDINFGVGKTWPEYMDLIYKRPEATVQEADIRYVFERLITTPVTQADIDFGKGMNWRLYMSNVYNRPDCISVAKLPMGVTTKQEALDYINKNLQ